MIVTYIRTKHKNIVNCVDVIEEEEEELIEEITIKENLTIPKSEVENIF
jgi:hypothetical protein